MMAYGPFDETHQASVASGINFLLGLWLIVSPWVFGFAPGESSMWNAVAVGVLIAVIAASRQRGPAAVSWLNVALGAWVIASPWVYGDTTNADRTWNSVVTGALALVLAWVSATTTGSGRSRPSEEYPYRDSTYRYLGYEPAPWYARYPHGSTVVSGALRGDHRGRGPTGYRRPDEEIATEIAQRMADDPWLDARDIEVRVSGGDFTLEGTVCSRAARRLAEEVCDSVSGVQDVENGLRVPRPAGESARRVA